ncbi:glycosyltransferase family 2 protein [Candidatus Saccharibacteria bacterium]|nr:glycosyltransferase family 2 protein [Candidatus Saccharibacteria bacterium]
MHNAEEFVQSALDSVAEQTFDDFECIIINDRSTDRSEAVITDFIKQHPHLDIKLCQTQKGKWGPGAARNVGMERSKGRYFIFLDADDQLSDPESLENISESISKHPNTEILLMGFYRYWWSGKGRIVLKQVLLPKTRHADKHHQIGKSKDGAMWSICWRNSLFKDNDISFDENAIWEDIAPKLRLFGAARQANIRICPHATHIYNIRPNKSTCTTPTRAKMKQLTGVHRQIGQLVDDGKIDVKYSRDIRHRLRTSPILMLWMLGMGLYSRIFQLV